MEHSTLVVAGSVIGIMSTACGLSWFFFNARLSILQEQLKKIQDELRETRSELTEIRAERNALRGEVELHRTLRMETLEENRELNKTVERLNNRLDFYKKSQ